MMETLQIIFLILGCFLFLVAGILGIIRINQSGKLWTANTNTNIKEALKEQKKIYKNINEEINNAGAINKWILKKKLGPLYKWYEGGFM